jgi:hypothetical protein
MSYQEKSITVSLTSSLMMWAFYILKIYQLYQDGGINPVNNFSLWATIIVLAIIVNITANIITHIVFGIIYGIKTKSEERMITDERDQLIDLRGGKVSYLVFSLGVLVSMITFVIYQQPLVMFYLLTFFGLAAEVGGDISRLYLYRRGF